VPSITYGGKGIRELAVVQVVVHQGGPRDLTVSGSADARLTIDA